MEDKLNAADMAYLRGACQAFFQALVDKDLHDHPKVFMVLDEEARKKGYMICALQRGIFGTTISFQAVD